MGINLSKRKVSKEVDAEPSLDTQIGQMSVRLIQSGSKSGDERMGGWHYDSRVGYNSDNVEFSGDYGWGEERKTANFRSISGIFGEKQQQLVNGKIVTVSGGDDSDRFQFDVGDVGSNSVELAGKLLPEQAWRSGVSSVRVDANAANVMMDAEFVESWLNFNEPNDENPVHHPMILFDQDLGVGGEVGDLRSISFDYSNGSVDHQVTSEIKLVLSEDGEWNVDPKATENANENVQIDVIRSNNNLTLNIKVGEIARGIKLPQVDTKEVLGTAKDLVTAIETGVKPLLKSIEFTEVGDLSKVVVTEQ